VAIDTWQVIDGCLFLNYDRDIKRKFNESLSGFIEKADTAWHERLAKTHQSHAYRNKS